MGDRRKSWLGALIEGLQSVAMFSGLAIIILWCYNVINHYDNSEYFYLLGLIFIISFLITLPRTIVKTNMFFQKVTQKLQR